MVLNAKALLHQFVQQNPAAVMPEVTHSSEMLPGNQPRFEATLRLREGSTRAGVWFSGGEFRGVAPKKKEAEQAAAAQVLAHLAGQGAMPREALAGIGLAAAAGGGVAAAGTVPPSPASLPQSSVAPTVRLTTTPATTTTAATTAATAAALAQGSQRASAAVGGGGAGAAGALAPPGAAASGSEAVLATINMKPAVPANDLPPLAPVEPPYAADEVGVADVEFMEEDELRERLTQALLQNQQLRGALDAVLARHREAMRLLAEATTAVTIAGD